MSLPNPDSVVTEERLSEFYAGIRPYLGGMPDVLANKFNKSDLYFTDEQLIGRWIDGKPLYQKTVDCGALPNATTKNVAHGISNLGDVIDIRGFAADSSLHIPLPQTQVDQIANQVRIDARETNIEIITGSSAFTSYTAYVTLQYTKTTDSAIAIGSDTDYSTDEKIVGTWIDGKPLYQKTVKFENQTLEYNKEYTLVENVDFLVKGSLNPVKIENNGDTRKQPRIVPYLGDLNSDYYIDGYFVDLLTTNNVLKYKFQLGSIAASAKYDLYFNLQYTKTTD